MRRTASEWERSASDYESSGKSQVEFSEERGITLSSLRYHLEKRRRKGKVSGVRELVLSERSEVIAEREFPGGITFRVRRSC